MQTIKSKYIIIINRLVTAMVFLGTFGRMYRFLLHAFTYLSCSGVRFIVHAIFYQTSVAFSGIKFLSIMNFFGEQKKYIHVQLWTLETKYARGSQPV